MIIINDIQLSFGSKDIFDHINCIIQPNQRIGLVGLNGAGKSTLLKAIAGQVELDGGSIAISGNKKIAYMSQEMVLNSTKNILDEALSVFSWYKLEQEIKELENNNNLEKLPELIAQFSAINTHQDRIDAINILKGLGFKEDKFNDLVQSLSVGWKMRIILAKLLLQKADFYLFDEPTNHLDLTAKDWFLSFLQKTSFGFLLVCHERYFLDHICEQIFEMEMGKGTLYQGNYTSYQEEKEHRLLLLVKAQQLQQKEIEHKKALIAKFKAKASKAKMAKSMEKMLDKIDVITLPPSSKKVNVSFGNIQQSGKQVLTVNNLSYSFDTKKIFDSVSFSVERAERVAIVAPNGTGKTTLFNVLSGKYKIQKGSITVGHNVVYTIFEQDQMKALNQNKTVFQEVVDSTPNKTELQIRSILGAFLFSKDDITKKISVLSGGEKNRVSMVKVLLKDANLLMLDEPTNHLDIPSKEILLHALQAYQGTIIFVSHDHDFINRLATRILDLTETGANSYYGNYEAYLYQRQAREELIKQQENVPLAKPNIQKNIPEKENFENKKELKKIESKITKLEKEIILSQSKFEFLEYNSEDYKKEIKLLQELEKELKNCCNEWEKIAE